MKRLKYIWKVVKNTAIGFNEDNCFRYSAALSFYTLFSIAPVVMIAIYVAGLFADDAAVRNEITAQFTNLMGERGAEGIMILMESLRREDQSIFSLILGLGILLFSATNIFVQIQTSFNEIFKVKVREGKSVIKLLLDRAISLGMILSLGFIMIITLVLDALVVKFVDKLGQYFTQLSISLAAIAEYTIIMGIVTAVIAALFRVLPDVIVYKKYLWRSAFITTILLLVGKFGIGWYIGNSNLSQLGGASSSVIILMLWVYYTSLILFVGAELIRAQLSIGEREITPNKYAVRIKSVKIEDDDEE